MAAGDGLVVVEEPGVGLGEPGVEGPGVVGGEPAEAEALQLGGNGVAADGQGRRWTADSTTGLPKPSQLDGKTTASHAA